MLRITPRFPHEKAPEVLSPSPNAKVMTHTHTRVVCVCVCVCVCASVYVCAWMGVKSMGECTHAHAPVGVGARWRIIWNDVFMSESEHGWTATRPLTHFSILWLTVASSVDGSAASSSASTRAAFSASASTALFRSASASCTRTRFQYAGGTTKVATTVRGKPDARRIRGRE